MELDYAIRNTDNRIIAALVATFAGLVFLIGVAANDVPGDVPITEATFDVAPPTTLPPPPSDVLAMDGPAALQLARLTLPPAPKQDETWFADETARGTRPDSLH